MAPDGAGVSFDVERALAIARRVTDDSVLVFATLTEEHYDIHLVSEETRRKYDAADADLDTVAETVHGYERLDFLEGELFNDMIPTVDSVSGFATFTDMGIITRVVNDRREGVYVSVEPETNVTELVAALEPVVRASDGD